MVSLVNDGGLEDYLLDVQHPGFLTFVVPVLVVLVPVLPTVPVQMMVPATGLP